MARRGRAGAINGTGNALANLITGNSGVNALDGAGGADTMIGAGGNDTINTATGNDIVGYIAMASILDTAANGTDTINNFDANPAGGQDQISLDALFDSLGAAFDTLAERQAATQWSLVAGSQYNLQLDLNGDAVFEYTIATVNISSGAPPDEAADLILFA